MNDIIYNASITKIEQLNTVLKYKIGKIYIPFDLFYWGLIKPEDVTRIHTETKVSVYISLPYIIRKKDELYLDKLKELLLLGKADGVLVRNLEEIGYLNSIEIELKSEYISLNGKIDGYTPLYIETDYTMYNWNRNSLKFNKEYSNQQTAPLELNIHELKELDDKNLIVPIYGRIPLMISANCVKKTSGNCSADCTHGSFEWSLKDRKNKSSLVYASCIHCYNVIFNSVITSLHKYMFEMIKYGFREYRIDFTNETNKEIDSVLSYYIDDMRSGSFPINEYTAAHISKGVI